MKQHYIPRCYLKRFSDNEKGINTYDKLHNKKYKASLMSVCCDDDIYTMSEGYVKKNNEEGNSIIDGLSIEKKYFADNVEPFFSQFLKQIDEIQEEWVSGKEHYRLQFSEKKELALHIVTQYFRMPQMGDSFIDDYIRMERAEMDMVKHIMATQTGNKMFQEVEIDLAYEKPALHASLSYMDSETMMTFADAIANNIYVFKFSKDKDFYTSDFPIVVLPHVENVRPFYMGLAQYGGELTMPLSPGLTLSVYDKKYFNDKKDLDCCFIEASDEEIWLQNYLRYLYATQHVFSYKNDFSLIDAIYQMKGEHPFWKPNYKTEIVSGLGRY